MEFVVNGSRDNSTGLDASCSGSPKTTEFAAAMQTSVYGILLMLSMLGNLLVMLVVSRTSEIKSTVNYFIFNMAVADLLFTMFVIPRKVSEVLSDQASPWYLAGTIGNVTCKACYFVQDVCTAVSVLTLVAIAVDRYYAIVFPMRSGLITSRVRKVLVTCIWIVAMGFHSPYFYAFRLITDPITQRSQCLYIWKLHGHIGSTYFLTSSAILFLFPLFTMTVIYSIILVTIRRRKIPGNTDDSRTRRHKERRNRRVLNMVVAVLLAFLICWLPFNIYGYTLFFGWYQPAPCSKDIKMAVILFLAYANAAINPFIYFTLSENYRIAAMHILKCRSRRQLKRIENTSLVKRNSSIHATTTRVLKVQLEMIDMSALQDACANSSRMLIKEDNECSSDK